MSSAKLMDWTAQLRREFQTVLLDAYYDRAMLQDFVARLGEPELDAAIASDRDLARTCADLLEYADSRGWLDRLYGEFVALHPERAIGRDPEARSAPLQLRRYRRKNQGFNEDLGEGVQLTMMRIPAGTFLMGAPTTEEDSRDHERPQHEVNVPEFCMGRYPVTQAQWRVVAGYEPVEAELNPEPSHFKGNDNRPVERVSWDDAQEFCRRLSVKSGKTYRLPSEAEWEYACRAGTQTPFHFGETIDAAIANYDAQSENEYWKPVYGAGKKGEYRQETTEVGQFPGNEWCLHDMHGNVWGWCEDGWHGSYESAPTDGSAWTKENRTENFKLLRGGSWNNNPRGCRSAVRARNDRVGRGDDFGFRMVCGSPRAL